VIATIAGKPVARADFDAYVATVITGDEGEEGGGPPSAELLSRLFDQFLDEELIVREAVKKGITVTEREVTDALRHLQTAGEATTSTASSDQAPARERMRRAILGRKFREQVLQGIAVSDEEIAGYYDAHRDEFHQAARLVLRQILLDDEGEARKVRAELLKDPSKFQEVAEQKSQAPDGGRPRAYEESELPPEVLEATKQVAEGGLSEIVAREQASRIFLVEKREPERLVGVDEARDGIRVALLQEKGRVAYEEFMKGLRRDASLVVKEENLGFAYKKRSA
jgi:parvulin-like peptidyl-prolyl isomerase